MLTKLTGGYWVTGNYPEVILPGIGALIRECKPHIVVIAGDVVNRDNSRSYKYAAKFLGRLFDAAEIDPSRQVLIIPGNHDVSSKKKPKANLRLRRFNDLLRTVRSKNSGTPRLEEFREEKIVFLLLDSTAKTISFPLANGEIGDEQIAWIAREYDKHANRLKNFTKIAVLHHHVTPPAEAHLADERGMMLIDHRKLTQALRDRQFTMVFHGHHHVPFVTVETYDNNRVLSIVASGTTAHMHHSEQRTHGNNVTGITIYPDINCFERTLYTADNKHCFRPRHSTQHYPLFSTADRGYAFACVRKIVRVAKNGVTTVKVIGQGLHAESPEYRPQEIAFEIRPGSATGKIQNFSASMPIDRIQYREPPSERQLIGDFRLVEPLLPNSEGIDLWYLYELVDSTPLSMQDLKRLELLNETSKQEGFVKMSVTNPMNRVEFELHLPLQYPLVGIRGAVWQDGAEDPLDSSAGLNVDAYGSIVRISIDRPPRNAQIRIYWKLPRSWQKPVS